MISRHVALLAIAATACAGGDAPSPAPTAEIIDAALPADAASAPAPLADDDTPDPPPGTRPVVRGHRTLELLLQSTPAGALAAVDGVIIGATPTYWQGEFTGQAHEFTFIRPGYAIARYQFVPVVNGIVHGRLQLISAEAAGRVPALPGLGNAPSPPAAAPPAAAPPASSPPAPAPPAADSAPPLDAPLAADPVKPTPGPMPPQPAPPPATTR